MPRKGTDQHLPKPEDLALIAGAFLTLLDTLISTSLQRIEAQQLTEHNGLLTRKEAAEYLAVSPTTLDRLRMTKRIKSVMSGKNRRYSLAELNRFIRREES